MKSHDDQVRHSSESPDWRTPPELFAALDRQFHFGLDAAASADSRLVENYLGPDHPFEYRQDAQSHELFWWHAAMQRPVFINPPWSRAQLRATKDPSYDIAIWAETCARQAVDHGATVVGIFPASTQTKWWQGWIRHGPYKAHEIREIPHRVTFLLPDGTTVGNAGGNTAVIIWQPNPGYRGDWQPVQRVWSYR